MQFAMLSEALTRSSRISETMNQLQVISSKFQMYLIAALAVFFIPVGLGLLVSSILGGFKIVPLGIGLLMLATFVGVVWMFIRGHRRSIKVFDDHGLSRNDGRKFAWSGLSRVVNKMRIKPGSEKRRLWRTEIQFNDGSSAWLIPSKVSNYSEVSAFVSGLQCEHIQEDA
jgi:hypothetical protein